jgi:hypothetical protein
VTAIENEKTAIHFAIRPRHQVADTSTKEGSGEWAAKL